MCQMKLAKIVILGCEKEFSWLISSYRFLNSIAKLLNFINQINNSAIILGKCAYSSA